MNKKKVLVITYYWPPSGGGGVQRWLKMVKYLPEYGWDSIVFTPKDPDFEIKDDSLLKDVLPETKVIKLPIWEPFGLYRKILGKNAVQKQGVVDSKNPSFFSRVSLWIRGNWFIPDPRIFWIRPAVNYLTKYLANNPVDVLITTGPPHSMHLIGMELKRRLGIKWVADFRDPWTDWDVLPQLNLSKRAWKYHRKLEQKVMRQTDMLLTVTNRLALQLAKTGRLEKVEVITNGYDVVDFQGIKNKASDKFRISHVGLLSYGRNPEKLWEVLDELCVESEEFNDNLEVVLVGTVDSKVQDSINSFEHLRTRVLFPEYMSHSEVIDLYSTSAVLLLLVNNTSNSSWILPGKLFEYLSAKKPVFAFGIKDSDANDVLSTCGYEGIHSYDEPVEKIKESIQKHYSAYLKGEGAVVNENVEKFERKRLTEELSHLLNGIVS